ncbi:hypothetical protein [Streptomyces marianii]|uniref:hypothetical protein n=1 Tax=Streptomyces marianii TaxID=1817406 RepID=UPI0018F8CA9C
MHDPASPHPGTATSFRVPLYLLGLVLGVLFCLCPMWGTGWTTWLRFAVFLAAGALVYGLHGRRNSRLAGTGATPSGTADEMSAEVTPEREHRGV